MGDAANVSSGIVGLLGIGIATVSAVAAAPIAATIGGIVLTAGAVGYVLVKAWPPTCRDTSKALGDSLSLGQLSDLHPPVLKVGVVGPTRAGKTTLLEHLCTRPPTHQRTEDVRAVIAALQTSPLRYVAILDGGGHVYEQQFRVAKEAAMLIVVLDHNGSDSATNASGDRLAQEAEFLNQMKRFLQSQGSGAGAQRLHFLLNKQDLWQMGNDKARVEDWFQDVVNEWKAWNWAKRVTWARHSNNVPANVTACAMAISDTYGGHA